MQRRVLKIIIILMPAFFSALSACAQASTFRLQQADSLYEKKRYTQSIEHYRTILDQHQYTPAMLLKMAYIEEGLNNIGPALYYLNLYHLATGDKTVLDKMEEVATRYNLEGYKSSDSDLALGFYHDYHFYISIGLAAIALFFLSLTLYWKRHGHRTAAAGIVLGVVLILLVAHVNFGERISQGIVALPNTVLMDGPSAGASVVQVVDAGHRVEIVGRRDVWLEVMWNDKPAYIKRAYLLPVRL